MMELKHSLEVKEQEVKAMQMEKKLLQLDLDRAQSNEKKLKGTVASLEAQLAIADQNLRTQNKIHSGRTYVSESCLSEVSGTRSGFCPKPQVKKSISSDSLEQSSLEDSLNSIRKPSIDSSTPLVRSSERLAAKRKGSYAESLETLYFTPINVRQTKRTGAEFDEEMDSARKNPTSSVKRRRTTQVINITLTKVEDLLFHIIE
ncbi:nuclear mitotic apparatus protein 1, partial [Oryzias melastigma]|uniref:nuclear mitotic apparatus protein 1 n=1 Tax=Oryzias melastigma TaxID=30732 RepID=UPI000CF813B5